MHTEEWNNKGQQKIWILYLENNIYLDSLFGENLDI